MNICVVCADESNIEKMHQLDCGHAFHANCIIDWYGWMCPIPTFLAYPTVFFTFLVFVGLGAGTIHAHCVEMQQRLHPTRHVKESLC